MIKTPNIVVAAMLFFGACQVAAEPSSSCVYIEAVNNSSGHQMYYKNNCGECVEFVPVVRNSAGQTRMGTNFPTLKRGTNVLRLEAGEGQNVFFDWKVGTWTGKANSVRACR